MAPKLSAHEPATFLDALASLKTMLVIKSLMFSRFHDYRVLESIAECKRVLQSITECYRVLTSITKCYRVLHSVPECYRVLENATENNTVLQSINDYYRSENDLFLTLGLGTSSA